MLISLRGSRTDKVIRRMTSDEAIDGSHVSQVEHLLTQGACSP